jgi:hypothetical protein
MPAKRPLLSKLLLGIVGAPEGNAPGESPEALGVTQMGKSRGITPALGNGRPGDTPGGRGFNSFKPRLLEPPPTPRGDFPRFKIHGKVF